MPKKKVKHYFNQCIGCGVCYSLAPNLFQPNQATFKAELIDGQLDPSAPAETNEAFTFTEVGEGELDTSTATMITSSCPVQIIKVEELSAETEEKPE